MKRITARVYGAVQGVGYRAFALSEARRLGLSGYVRNCADGSVEVVAEGEEEKLQSFLERLQRGPSASHVDYVDSVYSKAKGEFESFTIRY